MNFARRGEEAKVRERQDRHRRLAAAVRESFEQQIRDMRRAHAQAIAECEVRCRAVFGRAEVKKDTDFAEKLAALQAQLADAERLASVASEQRDALREELDEAQASKRLMLAKLDSQRQALEMHGAEIQTRLESELSKLRTAHEKLKVDVAKDVAMYAALQGLRCGVVDCGRSVNVSCGWCRMMCVLYARRAGTRTRPRPPWSARRSWSASATRVW